MVEVKTRLIIKLAIGNNINKFLVAWYMFMQMKTTLEMN